MPAIDLFRLDNKIALVSGASRGIGEAIAHGLAEQGAHVICASRKLESCEAVAQAIRDAGGEASAMACHAGNIEAIDALFVDIADRFGGIDILINNSGTNPYFGPVAETPMAAFDKTVEVKGTVAKNSIDESGKSFVITDGENDINITYPDMLPANFKEEIDVVIKGTLREQGGLLVIEANEIVVGCPSKY